VRLLWFHWICSWIYHWNSAIKWYHDNSWQLCFEFLYYEKPSRTISSDEN
jgi:hypothetical protein